MKEIGKAGGKDRRRSRFQELLILAVGHGGTGGHQRYHPQDHLDEHGPGQHRLAIRLALQLPAGAAAGHQGMPTGNCPAGDGHKEHRP